MPSDVYDRYPSCFVSEVSANSLSQVIESFPIFTSRSVSFTFAKRFGTENWNVKVRSTGFFRRKCVFLRGYPAIKGPWNCLYLRKINIPLYREGGKYPILRPCFKRWWAWKVNPWPKIAWGFFWTYSAAFGLNGCTNVLFHAYETLLSFAWHSVSSRKNNWKDFIFLMWGIKSEHLPIKLDSIFIEIGGLSDPFKIISRIKVVKIKFVTFSW